MTLTWALTQSRQRTLPTTTIIMIITIMIAGTLPITTATNHLAPLQAIIIAKLNKEPSLIPLTITQLMQLMYTLLAAMVVRKAAKKLEKQKKATTESLRTTHVSTHKFVFTV